MAPLGETVKNTAIVPWLFTVRRLCGEQLRFTKLSSPARTRALPRPGPRREVGARVARRAGRTRGGRAQILDAFARGRVAVRTAAVAIDAPGGGGGYLGAGDVRAALQAAIRRKARRAPGRRSTRSSMPGRRAAAAQLGRSASGPSGVQVPAWDLGAADRGLLRRRGFGGFVGLAVMDLATLRPGLLRTNGALRG